MVPAAAEGCDAVVKGALVQKVRWCGKRSRRRQVSGVRGNAVEGQGIYVLVGAVQSWQAGKEQVGARVCGSVCGSR